MDSLPPTNLTLNIEFGHYPRTSHSSRQHIEDDKEWNFKNSPGRRGSLHKISQRLLHTFRSKSHKSFNETDENKSPEQLHRRKSISDLLQFASLRSRKDKDERNIHTWRTRSLSPSKRHDTSEENSHLRRRKSLSNILTSSNIFGTITSRGSQKREVTPAPCTPLPPTQLERATTEKREINTSSRKEEDSDLAPANSQSDTPILTLPIPARHIRFALGSLDDMDAFEARVDRIVGHLFVEPAGPKMPSSKDLSDGKDKEEKLLETSSVNSSSSSATFCQSENESDKENIYEYSAPGTPDSYLRALIGTVIPDTTSFTAAKYKASFATTSPLEYETVESANALVDSNASSSTMPSIPNTTAGIFYNPSGLDQQYFPGRCLSPHITICEVDYPDSALGGNDGQNMKNMDQCCRTSPTTNQYCRPKTLLADECILHHEGEGVRNNVGSTSMSLPRKQQPSSDLKEMCPSVGDLDPKFLDRLQAREARYHELNKEMLPKMELNREEIARNIESTLAKMTQNFHMLSKSDEQLEKFFKTDTKPLPSVGTHNDQCVSTFEADEREVRDCINIGTRLMGLSKGQMNLHSFPVMNFSVEPLVNHDDDVLEDSLLLRAHPERNLKARILRNVSMDRILADSITIRSFRVSTAGEQPSLFERAAVPCKSKDIETTYTLPETIKVENGKQLQDLKEIGNALNVLARKFSNKDQSPVSDKTKPDVQHSGGIFVRGLSESSSEDPTADSPLDLWAEVERVMKGYRQGFFTCSDASMSNAAAALSNKQKEATNAGDSKHITRVEFPATMNIRAHSMMFRTLELALAAICEYKLGELSNFCIYIPENHLLLAQPLDSQVPSEREMKAKGQEILWLPRNDKFSEELLKLDFRNGKNTQDRGMISPSFSHLKEVVGSPIRREGLLPSSLNQLETDTADPFQLPKSNVEIGFLNISPIVPSKSDCSDQLRLASLQWGMGFLVPRDKNRCISSDSDTGESKVPIIASRKDVELISKAQPGAVSVIQVDDTGSSKLRQHESSIYEDDFFLEVDHEIALGYLGSQYDGSSRSSTPYCNSRNRKISLRMDAECENEVLFSLEEEEVAQPVPTWMQLARTYLAAKPRVESQSTGGQLVDEVFQEDRISNIPCKELKQCEPPGALGTIVTSASEKQESSKPAKQRLKHRPLFFRRRRTVKMQRYGRDARKSTKKANASSDNAAESISKERTPQSQHSDTSATEKSVAIISHQKPQISLSRRGGLDRDGSETSVRSLPLGFAFSTFGEILDPKIDTKTVLPDQTDSGRDTKGTVLVPSVRTASRLSHILELPDDCWADTADKPKVVWDDERDAEPIAKINHVVSDSDPSPNIGKRLSSITIAPNSQSTVRSETPIELEEFLSDKALTLGDMNIKLVGKAALKCQSFEKQNKSNENGAAQLTRQGISAEDKTRNTALDEHDNILDRAENIGFKALLDIFQDHGLMDPLTPSLGLRKLQPSPSRVSSMRQPQFLGLSAETSPFPHQTMPPGNITTSEPDFVELPQAPGASWLKNRFAEPTLQKGDWNTRSGSSISSLSMKGSSAAKSAFSEYLARFERDGK